VDSASQVLLRNAARLPAGPLLLVDPPRDDLFARLAQSGHEVTVSSPYFGHHRWLQSAGAVSRFEAAPTLSGAERAVLLHLPREKERLAMLLHAVAAQLDDSASLWLVGENRGGIKSAGRWLEERFERVMSLDKARHCGLFEATGPKPAPAFELEAYGATWTAAVADRELRLWTLPGVFAHRRLDAGTALLLGALEPLAPAGRVLDFACGSGVIAIALASAGRALEPTLLDHSALALESARRSLALNGVEGTLLASDGLGELAGRFDWIVSNPPFHHGVRNDLDTAAAFFRDAGTFLAENGRIAVVFNRHLPYESWLRQAFGQVQIVARDDAFTVALAQRA